MKLLTCHDLAEIIPNHYHCAHCGSYDDGDMGCENEHTLEVAGYGSVNLMICCSESWNYIPLASPEQLAIILKDLL